MDNTSPPLADYFWIAGIDSISYADSVLSPITPRDTPFPSNNGGGTSSPNVESTIEEGSESETSGSPPQTSNEFRDSISSKATARHSRTNSWNRLSKLSISTVEELETASRSNRSSMTIKASTANGNGTGGKETLSLGTNGNLMGEDGTTPFDFDQALLKFASERDSFLDALSFSGGAPVQKPAPMTKPRTERLKVEDSETNGIGNGYGHGAVNGGINGRKSPLRSVGGSIRRRISFRDMSSVKKQPSVQRSSEFERLSGERLRMKGLVIDG